LAFSSNSSRRYVSAADGLCFLNRFLILFRKSEMGFLLVGSRLLVPESPDSDFTVYRKIRSRCVCAMAKRPRASSNLGRFGTLRLCIELGISWASSPPLLLTGPTHPS